jgi:hypothetical protein
VALDAALADDHAARGVVEWARQELELIEAPLILTGMKGKSRRAHARLEDSAYAGDVAGGENAVVGRRASYALDWAARLQTRSVLLERCMRALQDRRDAGRDDLADQAPTPSQSTGLR